MLGPLTPPAKGWVDSNHTPFRQGPGGTAPSVGMDGPKASSVFSNQPTNRIGSALAMLLLAGKGVNSVTEASEIFFTLLHGETQPV